MNVSIDNSVYSNYHKAFATFCDNNADCTLAFRCTLTGNISVPIFPEYILYVPTDSLLPETNCSDYDSHPEYSKVFFNLSKHINFHVTLSDNIDGSDSDIEPTKNNRVHTPACYFEGKWHLTISFSFEDFANATFESLSPDHKELLSWHNCLGHLTFSNLQYLASTGAFSKWL